MRRSVQLFLTGLARLDRHETAARVQIKKGQLAACRALFDQCTGVSADFGEVSRLSQVLLLV